MHVHGIGGAVQWVFLLLRSAWAGNMDGNGRDCLDESKTIMGQEKTLVGRVISALPFAVGFLACFSIGLFCVFRASLFQKFYLALLSMFPRVARVVPMKGFIASRGYVWMVRLAGVGLLAMSIFW